MKPCVMVGEMWWGRVGLRACRDVKPCVMGGGKLWCGRVWLKACRDVKPCVMGGGLSGGMGMTPCVLEGVV